MSCVRRAGPMFHAATQVLFEGLPNYPDASRVWQVVDKYKVGGGRMFIFPGCFLLPNIGLPVMCEVWAPGSGIGGPGSNPCSSRSALWFRCVWPLPRRASPCAPHLLPCTIRMILPLSPFPYISFSSSSCLSTPHPAHCPPHHTPTHNITPHPHLLLPHRSVYSTPHPQPSGRSWPR